ncbi:MAG: hypothetical protein IBX50_15140 [Marinospirillum sp.]|nr:hypothetical protein [Marinospirillum sp.]
MIGLRFFGLILEADLQGRDLYMRLPWLVELSWNPNGFAWNRPWPLSGSHRLSDH